MGKRCPAGSSGAEYACHKIHVRTILEESDASSILGHVVCKSKEHTAGESPHGRRQVARVHALQLVCTRRPVCCMHLQAAGTTSLWCNQKQVRLLCAERRHYWQHEARKVASLKAGR